MLSSSLVPICLEMSLVQWESAGSFMFYSYFFPPASRRHSYFLQESCWKWDSSYFAIQWFQGSKVLGFPICRLLCHYLVWAWLTWWVSEVRNPRLISLFHSDQECERHVRHSWYVISMWWLWVFVRNLISLLTDAMHWCLHFPLKTRMDFIILRSFKQTITLK